MKGLIIGVFIFILSAGVSVLGGADVKIVGSGYLGSQWRVVDSDGDEICSDGLFVYQSTREIQCDER
jgi:hypothetical protein